MSPATRRGKRLTLGVVAVGLAVVLGLALAYRKPILEHVEAWHFQLTRETAVFEPFFGFKGKSFTEPGKVVQELADYSGCEVVFDAHYRGWFGAPPSEPVRPVKRIDGATRDVNYVAEIEAWGWRVLEQRFPRRAYVVIRDENAVNPPTMKSTTRSIPISGNSKGVTCSGVGPAE